MASDRPRMSWLERMALPIAPKWTLRRLRARAAVDVWQRHYEAASTSHRTAGWRRSSGDANAVIGPALARLREHARDLVRNNPYAESAVSTICDHTVGWGIVGKPAQKNDKALAAWRAWAESTDCDADGRHDLYGLQKLIMRTVVESGEVLIRRRFRLPSDGFALPLQIQVLDPDWLDTPKDIQRTERGTTIIQGVEYDGIGRRVAYWLFRDHPGSTLGFSNGSVRVPADGIRHIFRPVRPGQVRGISWFAPVLLKFKDLDEYDDASLIKQKIAACLAALTTDETGSGAPLGKPDDTVDPPIDNIQPGWIGNVPAGRKVEVIQPPSVREYPDFMKVNLRALATGLGVTYEDLTGDYTDMPFSAARMSRLRHWARVEDWRWRILIPQFCEPVWGWAMQAAAIMNQAPATTIDATWTAPPAPMVDPAAEGLAYMRNIRTGIMTLSEAIRERGYDPQELLNEYAADNKKLDELGIVLDSDARKMTQAGMSQAELGPDPSTSDSGSEEEDDERIVRVRPHRIA